MRRMLGALSLFAFAPLALAQSVFINEIHYDNTGADSGEAVEVAAPTGTDLTGWSLVPYNGSNGQTYSITALPAAPTGTCGDFDLYEVAIAGLQNGAPDGIALVDGGSAVIQFLSYEGTFAATNGPANGMMSVDIGVSEAGSGAVGNSLQLGGVGSEYADFTWQAEGALQTETFSACNLNQTLDATPPTVVSSLPASGSPTAFADVVFQVTFSEPVDGVDATDFALTLVGVTGASVSSAGAPGAVPSTIWNVSVNTGTGDGTIRLDVVDDDTILDAAGNALDGAFSEGTAIIIDKTAPTVSSVAAISPNPTGAATVDYLVTFSEEVGGVDTTDFAITEFNGLTGSTVNAVSGSGAAWTVTVNTGSPAGDLRLDVLDDDSILDAAGNALGAGSTAGDIYTIEKVPPTVVSILRASASPAPSDSSVSWTVVFSEAVTGVDSSDFELLAGFALSGATITGVSGSGTTWTVTADSGSGQGSLALNLVDDDSIVDDFNLPLGGVGAGNGSFVGGESFIIGSGEAAVVPTLSQLGLLLLVAFTLLAGGLAARRYA